jgi:hypothetical protein
MICWYTRDGVVKRNSTSSRLLTSKKCIHKELTYFSLKALIGTNGRNENGYCSKRESFPRAPFSLLSW